MQFSTLLLAAMASLAAAQNPFSFVTLPTDITVGTPFNITWSPSTGTTNTVSLVLRQGKSDALDTVTTIASNIKNSGSYLWTPTPDIVNGDGYAFEIVNDGNTAQVNYSGQFAISSPNTVSSARPSTTGSSTAASTSGLTTTTGSATTTTGSATTTDASQTDSETGSQTTLRATRSSSTNTNSQTGTGTTTSAPSATGNGATGLKVGGSLLVGVGAVMALL